MGFAILTARIIDRSTQEKLMDAAATYAGSFFMFLDTEFREECFHELQEPCEHLLLVMVAVQQDIVDFRVDRGAGIQCKKAEDS